MTQIYQIRTGNCLPNSRKYFECWCEAKKFVRNFLKAHAGEIEREDLLRSVFITRIDKHVYDNYPSVFPAEKDVQEKDVKEKMNIDYFKKCAE